VKKTDLGPLSEDTLYTVEDGTGTSLVRALDSLAPMHATSHLITLVTSIGHLPVPGREEAYSNPGTDVLFDGDEVAQPDIWGIRDGSKITCADIQVAPDRSCFPYHKQHGPEGKASCERFGAKSSPSLILTLGVWSELA
jgi:hypothetical protein